ncbi:TPA: hypothetical protein DEP58_00065 [Patescibacteria group bacterium]|nr:MAG: hypothetical protein UU98_C0002G0030 [Parcubacteria group bacterium GW2011_GWD2_42_14]HCC04685.1 hypothetical protein [Patescibacteria group bacterium]
MDNDPKSYRVPILRLKDVLSDSEGQEEGKDVSDTTPTTQKPNPSVPTSVTEEDILAAVIIPKGQQPIVLEASEKKDALSAPNQKKEKEIQPPVASQETIAIAKTSPPVSKTLDTTQKKSVVATEIPKPDTVMVKKIAVSPELPKTQEKKITTETIKVQAPTLESPQESEVIKILDANVHAIDEGILKKEFPNPEQSSVPMETPTVDLEEEALVEEVDDLANLYSLVEENLASEETQAEQQENTQPTEKAGIVEEEPIHQEIIPRIPVPEPLDIWELDAAKPRVPYKPKPIIPKPPVVEIREVETKKEFIAQNKTSQSTLPQKQLVSDAPESVKNTENNDAMKEEPSAKIKNESGSQNTKLQQSETNPLSKLQSIETSPLEGPKKSDGLSNLSALRERAQKEEVSQATNNPHPQELSSKNVLDSSSAPNTQNRPRPSSKHAQVLAEVAERLHDIGNPKTEAPIMEEKKAVPIETPPVPEATQKVIPGALEKDTPKPTFKPVESSIPMIRTFRQDVEQAVTRNRTSVVDMISAEEKRRSNSETIRRAPHPAESSWSYVFIGASMILVIAAIAIGAFLFFRLMTNSDTGTDLERIPINETISYDLTSQSRDQILTGLVKLRDSLHTSLGSITQIQLTERKNVDDTTEKKSFVSTSLFLLKIESHAPGSLVRNLADTMMFGIHELTKNEPFFIFTATHYDITFKSMFEWESTIQDDLAPLFGTPVKIRQSVATTSNATGTASVVPTRLPPELFEDIVIANTQTRGIRNTSGDVVLIWAIPDETTLIITNNETTMRTLLERMDARPF